MRIKLMLSAILALTVFSGVWAEGQDPIDPYRIGYLYDNQVPDLQVQKALQNGPLWQNFVADHPNWMARFDERTGLPHRAFGTPFYLGSADEATVKSFIQQAFPTAQLPLDELSYLTKTETVNYDHLILEQTHQGMKVKHARADFKFTKDGRLVMLGFDVHPNIALAGGSELSESALATAAMANLPNVTDAEFKGYFVYPLPDDGAYDYRKIAEFTVHSNQNIPAIYTTYVDVHDGTVLYRENQVHTFATDTTHVRGNVRTGKVFQPETSEPFIRVRVEVDGTNYDTDDNGDLFAPLNSPSSAVVRLLGDWVSVREDPLVLPVSSSTLSLSPTTDTLDITDLFSVEARAAYYHTDVVHDHMKQYFPSFVGLDNPLPCNIEITPHDCNAFYDGSSINFFTESGSCYSLAQVPDVVYHEYGHGINGRFYSSFGVSFSNGGMNEGYADIWGISITQDSILAQGITPGDTADYIRRYDQGVKVYPDDWMGQVHNDGEIIAGAFWDSFRYTGISMDSLTKIWTQGWFGLPMQPHTLGGTGMLYYDVLLETLMADDVPANGGDNDVTNGTPNGIGIARGFTEHGISLMGIIDLTHSPVSSAAINSGITITAQANAQFDQYLGGINCYYQINDSGQWNVVPMPNTSGITYEGVIPGQPAGTIIDYFVSMEDASGLTAIASPFKGERETIDRNLSYNIMVGFNQMGIEDFDFNQGSWLEGISTDTAVTGQWIIDIPEPTFDGSGAEVQPGSQNTPGGFICAFTGNGPAGGALGVNDVDDGQTTLQSPSFDLSTYSNPAISYYRWYSNNSGNSPGVDLWKVYISNDGTNWVLVEDTRTTDASWRRNAIRVADYVTPSATVALRFEASDYLPGSLVEAAVDDLEIWEQTSISLEESELTKFNIYPNPTADQLTLDMELINASSINVEIVDPLGRLVQQNSLGILEEGRIQKSIDVRGLAPGSYQLILRSNGMVTTKPFVKR